MLTHLADTTSKNGSTENEIRDELAPSLWHISEMWVLYNFPEFLVKLASGHSGWLLTPQCLWFIIYSLIYYILDALNNCFLPFTIKPLFLHAHGGMFILKVLHGFLSKLQQWINSSPKEQWKMKNNIKYLCDIKQPSLFPCLWSWVYFPLTSECWRCSSSPRWEDTLLFLIGNSKTKAVCLSLFL